MGTKVS